MPPSLDSSKQTGLKRLSDDQWEWIVAHPDRTCCFPFSPRPLSWSLSIGTAWQYRKHGLHKFSEMISTTNVFSYKLQTELRRWISAIFVLSYPLLLLLLDYHQTQKLVFLVDSTASTSEMPAHVVRSVMSDTEGRFTLLTICLLITILPSKHAALVRLILSVVFGFELLWQPRRRKRTQSLGFSHRRLLWHWNWMFRCHDLTLVVTWPRFASHTLPSP